MIEDMIVATRSNRRPVKKGDSLTGVRVVPLIIDEKVIQNVENISATKEIIQVKPFRELKAGIITTGSEVFSGRIEDKFGPSVQIKIEDYGCKIIKQIIVPDFQQGSE